MRKTIKISLEINKIKTGHKTRKNETKRSVLKRSIKLIYPI